MKTEKKHRHKFCDWFRLWSGNFGRFCTKDECLEEQIKIAKAESR